MRIGQRYRSVVSFLVRAKRRKRRQSTSSLRPSASARGPRIGLRPLLAGFSISSLRPPASARSRPAFGLPPLGETQSPPDPPEVSCSLRPPASARARDRSAFGLALLPTRPSASLPPSLCHGAPRRDRSAINGFARSFAPLTPAHLLPPLQPRGLRAQAFRTLHLASHSLSHRYVGPGSTSG